MIESNKLIPEIYGRSRDIQVFTKAIDIIVNVLKNKIDKLGDLYDADVCPEAFLPLLAITLNYQYNYNDTVESNRQVIKMFTILEKNRGSEVGLLMSAALSLTSLYSSVEKNELFQNEDYLTALGNLNIEYDYENAEIIITYPHMYTLVRNLMDYVRPVGMKVTLLSVEEAIIDADELLVYANVDANVRKYNPNIDSSIEGTEVNFSGLVDDKWLNQTFGSNIVNLNE